MSLHNKQPENNPTTNDLARHILLKRRKPDHKTLSRIESANNVLDVLEYLAQLFAVRFCAAPY
jgi:hypothetical protein